MIKTLHISAVSGGVDTYLNIIVNNISDSYEQYLIKNEDFKGVPNTQKKVLPLRREIRLLPDVKSLIAIVSYIRKTQPDVIHLHSAKAGVLGRLAGIICRKKMIYTPHAFSYLSTNNRIKRMMYMGIERLLKHSGNFILATSESEKKRAIEELNYRPQKVLLFNNSIRPILPIENNIKIPFEIPENFICSIGRPCYQKNIMTMVNVFAQVKKEMPSLKFVLMGVGHYSPDYEEVKIRVQQLGLENDFIMLPWVEREQTFKIVEKSLLYVSTSIYEGLPYSIIEALALKKACVVSDCDGNRDLVKDNYNGYVIAQENLEIEMPKAIVKLLNSDIRHQFGENSFKRFKNEFNILINIQKLEAIYNSFSHENKSI